MKPTYEELVACIDALESLADEYKELCENHNVLDYGTAEESEARSERWDVASEIINRIVR